MNKTVIAGAVIVAVAASGCALAQRQAPQGGTVVKASGTLQPEMVVDVTSGIRGKIKKLLPGGEWGASVKKGDALVEIDATTFQADLAIARASVAEAEAGSHSAKAHAVQAEQDLERAKNLRATGGVTQAELDKYRIAAEVGKANLAVADAKVARSKAVLARAQLDLDACTIRSPIEGVIIDRRVNVGQIVSEHVSAPSLFLIAGDLKKLQVWASVKEADITRVAKGQAATFTVEAFPKDTFKGRVSQIRLNAALLKDQVTYTVVIDVDNREGRLMPYLSAEVTVAAAQEANKKPTQPNGPVDKLKTEVNHLQGQWKLVSLVHDGNAVKSGDNVLTIKDEQITEKSSDDVIQYKLNPGKELKEIDLVHLEGRHKGETFAGIYMLEGDLLFIAHGHYSKRERPTDFQSLPETGTRALLFRRVKAK